jgi:hypothetical protein
MHTDKSEDTGMGLRVRSAGSFHGFRVSQRDMNNYLEKFSVGFAPLSPPYTPFHGFRVSRRDVKSCYEKLQLFMISGVPVGHEMLRYISFSLFGKGGFESGYAVSCSVTDKIWVFRQTRTRTIYGRGKGL